MQLSFGADSNDVISNIVLDKFGNFYVAANFSNTITIDKITNQKISSRNNSQDILLAKFNAFGKSIWYKKMGGIAKDEVHDLKIDANGNLYMVGNFTNECSFSSGSKNATLISSGKTDGFIAKFLSGNGELDWATKIGGEWNDDIFSICLDKMDGVIVSGRFTKLADADNSNQTHLLISTSDELENSSAFIARYNAYDGKYIFAITSGITNRNNTFQSQNCVEADEKNNFYFLSTFTNEIDINPNGNAVKYNSAGKNDLILIKYDLNGKVIESILIGGGGNENCNNRCIAINKQNEVTIAFSYQNNCLINCKNKPINLSAKNEVDLAIIKLNNKLSNIIFNSSVNQAGSMNNNQILADDDKTWIVGYSKNKQKSVADKKQKSTSSINSTNSYFIYKLDSDGKIVSQKTSLNASENCAFHTLQFNSFTNDLYIGGNYNNSFTFNNQSFKSKGKKDFFILKLNDDFSNWKLTTADTSNGLTTENFTIDVKSNQQSTLLNIKYFADKTKNCNITLLDYKGNVIKQIQQPKQNSGLQQIFYDISFLPNGEYFIKQNDKLKCFIK